MRPLRPAPAPTVAMPRLHAGWRLLAGAVPLALNVAAHADATLPGSADGASTAKSAVVARPGRTAPIAPPTMPCPGLPPQIKPPTPPNQGPKPKTPDKKAAQAKPGVVTGSTAGARWMLDGRELAVTVVTHPHGPDEPCRKVGT